MCLDAEEGHVPLVHVRSPVGRELPLGNRTDRLIGLGRDSAYHLASIVRDMSALTGVVGKWGAKAKKNILEKSVRGEILLDKVGHCSPVSVE